MFKFVLVTCVFVGHFSFAETAPAPEAANPGPQSLSCEGKGTPRKLVIATKDKGCELQYSKAEVMDVIATQKMGTSYCEEKLQQVKTKLEAAGYKCQ